MYVKLFTSILESSIWSEDAETRLVWITMLAMADREGHVRASISGLARRANVSVDGCRAALERLQQPDPESATEEHRGRRIEPVEGGWLLFNYVKYREIRTEEQLKAAARQRRKYYREKRETSRSLNTDADTEADTKKYKGLSEPETFAAWWAIYPKRAGGNPRAAAVKAYGSRLKEGVSSDDLLQGLRRYARYCEVAGKVGTEYIKQAQFWLSKTYRGWEESWDLPVSNDPGEEESALVFHPDNEDEWNAIDSR